jgi:hypothetical protein
VWLWFEDEHLAKIWQALPMGKRGAQPKYSDTAIQTVLMLKVVFWLTNRSIEGFVSSMWAKLGYELTSPDHVCKEEQHRQRASGQCLRVRNGFTRW